MDSTTAQSSNAPDSAHPHISAERLFDAQLAVFYRQGEISVIASIISASLVTALFATALDWQPLLVWLGLYVASHLAMLSIFRRFPQQRSPQDNRHWYRLTMLLGALIGSFWGAMAWVAYVPDSPGYILLLCTVIYGISSSSLWTMAHVPAAYYLLAVLCSVPLIARLIWENSSTTLGLAAVSSYIVISSIAYFRVVCRDAADAIRLGLENSELIEDLAEQNQRVKQASAAKTRFLASASHDLRQPLQAQALYIDALGNARDSDEEQHILQRLKHSNDALNELMNSLLDISKLDAGTVSPDLQAFSLNKLFTRLAGEYALTTRESGLRCRILPTEAVVRSDPVLLETILRNLLNNAVRYTHQGHVVMGSRADARPGWVCIEVRDSGIGIPEEKHRQIFEEFYQLENPGRDRAKGLGLGLAIVQRLSRLLDHPIALRSNRPHGTIFSLRLPVGQLQTAPLKTALHTPANLSGALIVIIDDEQAIRDGLAILLDQWGCRSIGAASAAEAVEQLGATQIPDVVIADHRLQNNESGIQAIDAIQAQLKSEIPAFLITGDSAPEHIQTISASGLPVLHKPVAPAKLRALLSYLLQNKA